MNHPTSQTEIRGCSECVLSDKVFRDHDDDVYGKPRAILYHEKMLNSA